MITGNYPGARDERINNVHYRRVGTQSSYLMSRITYSLLGPFALKKMTADLIVHDASFFSPSFAHFFARCPHLTIIHHLMGRHALRLFFPFGFIPYWFEKGILWSAKNILTPSLAVKRRIRSQYPDKDVHNIANGVDNSLFTLLRREEPFMLFLGRIDFYMKGLDILIKAFAGLTERGVSLKIAGSGKAGHELKLKQLIEKLKMKSRVEILGRVSKEKKKELLSTCLFLVMPSRFEGWGITAAEANAVGKAVIGTRIDGLTEAVADGETALLVEPEDAGQLTEAMETLLADRAKRKKLGEAGREHARQYAWDKIARRQLTYYETIIKKNVNHQRY